MDTQYKLISPGNVDKEWCEYRYKIKWAWRFAWHSMDYYFSSVKPTLILSCANDSNGPQCSLWQRYLMMNSLLFRNVWVVYPVFKTPQKELICVVTTIKPNLNPQTFNCDVMYISQIDMGGKLRMIGSPGGGILKFVGIVVSWWFFLYHPTWIMCLAAFEWSKVSLASMLHLLWPYFSHGRQVTHSPPGSQQTTVHQENKETLTKAYIALNFLKFQ